MQAIKKIIVWVLTLESRLILAKYRPFIVAVTGSVGKTSTKDAIYCVLKDESRYVRKTDKSFNSEIGLPLTVIGAPNAWHDTSGWLKNMWRGLELILWRVDYPDCLILEVGADHPGDIKRVAKWLKPDIAVITKVSSTPVHVEFFKSPEQVFEEKASLAECVKKGGTVILNGDDAKAHSIEELPKVKEKNVKIIKYGTSTDVSGEVSVKAKGLSVVYADEDGLKVPTGMTFNINLGMSDHSVTVKGVLGETYQYPLLAAAACGKAKGMSDEAIVKLLNSYTAPKARMNVIAGLNGSTLIDDTYNSSPDAASSALNTLRSLECSGSKIAILGDMMELGKYSAEQHRIVGKEAAGIASQLITVGPRSKMTADEAIKSGLNQEAVRAFDNANEAADFATSVVKPGDIILVKGSQSTRMERVSKALLRDQSKASELLVRQEKEWLNR